MSPSYSVKTVISQNGEEMPMLKNLNTGLPEFEPIVYVLTHHRQDALASSTMARALYEISYLHIYLEYREIDLDGRFSQGLGLSLQEIDGLVNHLSRPAIDFPISAIQDRLPTLIQATVKGKNLEKVRMRAGKQKARAVCNKVYSCRLRTARDYLEWRIDQFISRNKMMDKDEKKILRMVKKEVSDWITARIRKDKGRNQVGQREGLDPQVVERLLSITACDSPDNPWRSRHCQIRNALIVSWLRKHGVRRGELLAIKISDIDFQKETVLIPRRPDDPEDPRNKKAKAKTLDRVLPIGPELASATHNYIMNFRRKIGVAKSHPFLFVSNDKGLPLTLDGCNKIFRDLKKHEFDLPRIFPHLFRHTWNDDYSEEMDAKKIPPAEEEQMRSYLMGWSSTSSTAKTYTRRTIRKRAQRASIEMQEKMALPTSK